MPIILDITQEEYQETIDHINEFIDKLEADLILYKQNYEIKCRTVELLQEELNEADEVLELLWEFVEAVDRAVHYNQWETPLEVVKSRRRLAPYDVGRVHEVPPEIEEDVKGSMW